MGSEEVMEERQLHSFSWNHHRQTFFNTVFKLRKQEMFCDITLACDGALFPAHRLVLAMCSEFFSEVLTKLPFQQPMVLLVPTVAAADLEALLTYIYQGEIRISQTNLPSLMQAAQTLKIKGLCSTNNGMPWEQYARRPEGGETNADLDGGESNSYESIVCEPPNWFLDETTQDSKLSPQSLDYQLAAHPQVEVFIHGEDSDDMNYEGRETKEKEEEESITVWMKEEEEEEEDLDPLSMPLPPPNITTLAPASSPHDPVDTSLLRTAITVDSDPNFFLNKFCVAASSSTTAPRHSYTLEQKMLMWKYYHTYGPVKTARMMSQLLGRKMNESSVRSVVKALRRNSKSYDEDNNEVQLI